MADFEHSRVEILLAALGIDTASFLAFLEWALDEQLVASMAAAIPSAAFFTQPDALKQFRSLLRKRSGRDWSTHDLNLLCDAVKLRKEEHFRDAVEYGDYLRLLWNTPHECARCGREPPEVKLHIDHVRPVALGGNSKYPNLQFLCQECNLKKSASLEEGLPWLDLQ